jgi:hypothetical protein
MAELPRLLNLLKYLKNISLAKKSVQYFIKILFPEKAHSEVCVRPSATHLISE